MIDIERDIFLGFVRVHVLHHAAEEPIFGVGMLEELARHGYRLSPGTLYPVFHGLEKSGLLVSEQKIVGGKARKYYRITGAGRKVLADILPRIQELVDEITERKADARPRRRERPIKNNR